MSTTRTPIRHSDASSSPRTRLRLFATTSLPTPAFPDAAVAGSLMISVSVGLIASTNSTSVSNVRMIGRILKMKSTFLNIFAMLRNTFASWTIFMPLPRSATLGCSSGELRICSSVGRNSSLPITM